MINQFIDEIIYLLETLNKAEQKNHIERLPYETDIDDLDLINMPAMSNGEVSTYLGLGIAAKGAGIYAAYRVSAEVIPRLQGCLPGLMN